MCPGGYGAVCLGNHELDLGHRTLVDRLGEVGGATVLNSNLHALQGQTIPAELAPRLATVQVSARPEGKEENEWRKINR